MHTMHTTRVCIVEVVVVSTKYIINIMHTTLARVVLPQNKLVVVVVVVVVREYKQVCILCIPR